MEYIKIGKILNTRGIKGELKIKPFTDFQLDRYKKGKIVFIFFDNEYVQVEVKQYKSYKNMDLLVFENYEDINLVEKFKGFEIYVLSEDETTLNEGEYHLSEIINMKVFQGNILIGYVNDVKPYPQGDYLEILTIDKVKKLIPFRDEFVISVNLETERIEIVNMEGLL
jgi:16S rRNA processing protein RimM